MWFSNIMQTSLSRRRLSLLLASSLAAQGVFAAPATPTLPKPPAPPQGAGLPFDEISPRVETDRHRVRLLFSYECNHCRTYHNAVHEWGRTIPQPFRFTATPIITDSNSQNNILAVYGRIMAEMIDSKALRPYDLMIYELIQGDPSRGVAAAGRLRLEDIMSVLVRAGIPMEKLKAFSKSNKPALVEKRLPEHARAIQTFGLKATPSIALGGRYLITPDHTGGNAQQFVSLLNGLLSRMLERGSI